MARRVDLRFGEQALARFDQVVQADDPLSLSDSAVLVVGTGAVVQNDSAALTDAASTVLTTGVGSHFTDNAADALGLGDTVSIAASQHFTVAVTDTTGLRDAASENKSTSGAVTMLLGVSNPNSNHGGINDWDGYRAYTFGTMNNWANGSTNGNAKPKFLAYSEAGPNLGDTSPDYTTIFNHVRSVLDTFYYSPASGQTHSSRWGIKLFWSNGNENFDKGVLGPSGRKTAVSQASVDLFVTSQKALYDACHYVDPSTGQRRYPDAYAGSNPTTGAENDGLVQQWLHPSAQYHDFVMWSMYPPDQGDPGTIVRYDWPSFTESDRTTQPLGHMIRCFYRTKQAQAQARIDRGDPNYRLAISCGETGTTYSPSDTTLRPYWAVNAAYRGGRLLSTQYDLDMPFMCWFDNSTSGRAHAFSDDQAGTNPTTAQAWRNAPSYCTTFGGTKPSSWALNPKQSWTTSGPVF